MSRVAPSRRWLKTYSGQSTAQLIAMESKYDLASLLLALEQALGMKVHRFGATSLSLPERTVIAVEALEREVMNGGYQLFFQNSSKVHAPQVVAALKRIQSFTIAKITQDALSAIGLRGRVNRKQIDIAMAKLNPKADARLRRCDEVFFLAGCEITPLLFRYVKANRDRVSIPR